MVELWDAEEMLGAEWRRVLSREGLLACLGVLERLGALAHRGLLACLGVFLDGPAPTPREDRSRGQRWTGSEYCDVSAGNLAVSLAKERMRTVPKLEVAARKRAGCSVWWEVTLATQEERCHCSTDREHGGVDASGLARKKVAARS